MSSASAASRTWWPNTKRRPSPMLASTGPRCSCGAGSVTGIRSSASAAAIANPAASAYATDLPAAPTSRPPIAGPSTSPAWNTTLPMPAPRANCSRLSARANSAL